MHLKRLCEVFRAEFEELSHETLKDPSWDKTEKLVLLDKAIEAVKRQDAEKHAEAGAAVKV